MHAPQAACMPCSCVGACPAGGSAPLLHAALLDDQATPPRLQSPTRTAFFMRPGSSAIELTPHGFEQHWPHRYFQRANSAVRQRAGWASSAPESWRRRAGGGAGAAWPAPANACTSPVLAALLAACRTPTASCSFGRLCCATPRTPRRPPRSKPCWTRASRSSTRRSTALPSSATSSSGL